MTQLQSETDTNQRLIVEDFVDKICADSECLRADWARGLCQKHYLRAWRTGAITVRVYSRRSTPIERFLARVQVTESCWLWTGTRTDKGYGQIQIDKVMTYVHRFSYEWFVGPIPDGLDIDHLCRVRHCVNPDHLDPATRSENVLRGRGWWAGRPGLSAHCPQGHRRGAGSAYRSGHCKECVRNRYQAKKSTQVIHN